MIDIFQLLSLSDVFFITGLLMILGELFVGIDTGLDLLLAGSILIISGFVGMGFDSIWVAIGSVIMFSSLYFVYGRKKIKEKVTIVTKHTNIDKLIGKTAIVIKPINSHRTGSVILDNETWRATSDSNKSITINTKVKVTGISGVTLQVKKI